MILFLLEWWAAIAPAYFLIGYLSSLAFAYADGGPCDYDASNTAIAVWLWPVLFVFFIAYGFAHVIHYVGVRPIMKRLFEKAQDDPS